MAGGELMGDYLGQLLTGGAAVLVPVAAGAGVLVLLVLALVLLRKKKPRGSPTGRSVTAEAAASSPQKRQPRSASQRREIAVDFSAESLGAWRNASGGNAQGAIADGAYRLNRNQSARSAASLPASPGRAYRVHFRAAALADATNGGKNNFFVGPMYLDAEGKVVGWYKEQPPISVAEGQRAGEVESIAPANAATVHISMHGNWAKDAPAGDGVIAFSELRLVEV